MSLRDLLLYKEEYNRPVVFGIDWSSEISPDDNYAVGIGIRGFLFAASFSGKFYICTSVEHGWRIKGDYDQINSEIAAMKRNFQDGVDTIYGKIVSLGVTPSGGKTPNACAASIQTIYDLQYDNGYDDGYAKGKAEIVDLGVINASSQSGSNTRDSTFKLTTYQNKRNVRNLVHTFRLF